jgi:hypothetical protein
MLLEYGDIGLLQGKEWYMLEIGNENTVEPTMRRLGIAVPNIFRNHSIEIFIPVFKRDLDVFEMKTGAILFVRSTSFQGLVRLRRVTGVQSLVTVGDCNVPSKAIPVDDDYVQTIIAESEKEFLSRSEGIEVGSFVRVLNGDTRDYCGVVEAIGDGRATVRIALTARNIILDTPIRNLLNISHVPPDQRVYYFCPLVEELVTEHPEIGPRLLRGEAPPRPKATPAPIVVKRGRGRPRKNGAPVVKMNVKHGRPPGWVMTPEHKAKLLAGLKRRWDAFKAAKAQD